jgi:hypothetical protein
MDRSTKVALVDSAYHGDRRAVGRLGSIEVSTTSKRDNAASLFQVTRAAPLSTAEQPIAAAHSDSIRHVREHWAARECASGLGVWH